MNRHTHQLLVLFFAQVLFVAGHVVNQNDDRDDSRPGPAIEQSAVEDHDDDL